MSYSEEFIQIPELEEKVQILSYKVKELETACFEIKSLSSNVEFF